MPDKKILILFSIIKHWQLIHCSCLYLLLKILHWLIYYCKLPIYIYCFFIKVIYSVSRVLVYCSYAFRCTVLTWKKCFYWYFQSPYSNIYNCKNLSLFYLEMVLITALHSDKANRKVIFFLSLLNIKPWLWIIWGG